MEKEVSTLKTSVVDCNEKIASVDTNVSELSDNLPKIVSEQVSQIIDDKSEEVKRQSNVFGVPENEEGYPRLNDLEFVTDLCSQSLGVNDIVVEELTRLRENGREVPVNTVFYASKSQMRLKGWNFCAVLPS